MSDVTVSVVESTTSVTVSNDVVDVSIVESPVTISTGNSGPQGASYNQGDPIYERIRNSTGSTLLKGQIVYLSGATGNHVNVSLALASGDATSARTIGWISENIANNAEGFVMMFGYLEGIDTSAASAVGDILYLSPTVPGGWTSTKPSAPQHMVYVGVCVRKNPSNGAVSVHIQNGYELGELHDVAISSPVNNQVLTYDSATDLWVNATNPADGVTSITATAPLTGGTITSTGSIGLDQTALSIAQSQVSGLVSDLAGKANLAGGNAFTGAQTVTGTATGSIVAIIKGASGQANDLLSIQNNAGTPQMRVNLNGSAFFGQTTASYPTFFGAAGSLAGMINVVPASAAVIPIIIRGAASQSAHLLQLQDSSGTVLSGVSASGRIYTGTAPLTNSGAQAANISALADAATVTPLIVRGAASQTANLQEWQSSAGATALSVNSAGLLTGTRAFAVNQSNAGEAMFVLRGAASQTGDALAVRDSSANTIAGFSATGRIYSGVSGSGQTYLGGLTLGNGSVASQMGIVAGAATTVGAVIRGAASQTADLLQIQDSAGNNNVSVSPTFGLVGRNAGTLSYAISSGAGLAAFYSQAPTNVLMTLRGAASQTADALQLQDSAGNTYLNMTVFGGLSSNLSGTYPGRWSVGTGTAGTIGLVVRGSASQSANLLELQNSAANILASFDSSGQLRTPAVLNPNSFNNSRIRVLDAGLIIDTGVAGNVALAVTNTNASPTGDLFRANGTVGSFQITSSGGVRSAINVANSFGGGTSANNILAVRANVATNVPLIVSGAASQTANLQSWQDSSGNQLTVIDSSGFIKVGDSATGGQVAVTATAAGNRPLVLKGAASQSANLTEWQDSAGTVLASIGSGGALNVNTSGTGVLNLGDGQISKGPGSGFTFNSGLNNVTSLGVGTTALNTEPFRVYFGAATYKTVIRGAASQTANLTEWQSSAGTIQSRITSSGAFVTTSLTASSAVLNTGSAAVVPITARGATSQTANLQEWQNSAGTVLASMASGGDFFANRVRTLNSAFRGQEGNGGGQVFLERNTSLPTNPGANFGLIYFRDGTNAGTLKLVVRAGAAGAETTILDNIPQ